MTEVSQPLLILQVTFGAVLVILGMMLLTMMNATSLTILSIAVALLCFKDGLIQLTGAFLEITKEEE